MAHTNRLAKETSPYLLQHAHNPVDWFPWSEEALQKARSEDKPILVSIGYAACHWCHVMERESFEDADTARFMNEHFVNIKIDREERPDLDHIYMDAVQAITGSGGWPLNVFLPPEGKPFYGGTYFPPRPVSNRASCKELLGGVAGSFKEKRAEVKQQADNLTNHVAKVSFIGNGEGENPFTPEMLRQIRDQLLATADKEEGGFGGAPKFPQTFSIRFLLHYYYFTKDTAALDQACLSLDKMIRGGIYDQLGGGFARYSTDNEWLAPHFEKMLYDNALLIITLSEAWQLTKKEGYREAIEQCITFIDRELSNGQGGFYSALDADSEGIYFYYHSYKGEARYPAFLDDYANLIAALIGLQEITGDGSYLLEAREIMKTVIDHFSEPETGFFFYTHAQQQDLVLRKKEVYDGAIPSGNSMMASNLLYLSVVFDEPDWLDRAFRMASALSRPVSSHPGSFGVWATLFQAFTYTIPEVVVTGRRPEKTRKEFLEHLIPYRVFQSTDRENTQFPLLLDKLIGEGSLIFLCENYSCQLPVNAIATVIRNLENVYKFQH